MKRMDTSIINTYITDLKKLFAQVLVPEAKMLITVYNYPSGAVIKIELTTEGENSFSTIPVNSQTDAYNEVKLERFVKVADFTKVNLAGTNIVDNGNEILILKEGDDKEWLHDAVKDDFTTILRGGQNA